MSDRRTTGHARITPARRIDDVRTVPLGDLARDESAPSNNHLTASEQRLYDKGLRDGLAQGRESGRNEALQQLKDQVLQGAQQAGQVTAKQMDSVLRSFQSEFHSMQQVLADKTLDLALAIAQTVVAREVESDRSVVLPVIQDCIEPLGKAALDLKVTLHPDDFAAVEQAIAQAQIPAFDYLVSDPNIEPGGCILESDHSLIDAQLATRWQRTLASMGRHE